METKVALAPPLRRAFTTLIDYAGLFPPAQLSLADAATEYRRARAGAHAWMLGRFIIPASRLGEPRLTPEGGLSVIVDADFDALKAVAGFQRGGIAVEAVEIRLTTAVPPLRKSISTATVGDALAVLEADIAMAGLEVPAFVEIPRLDGWSEALPASMELLARANLGAKLRCGGVTADAFPSVDEVAEFVAASCTANVRFKATAGLHHPIRHFNEQTGLRMHGFLNLLVAAALAQRVNRHTLREVVAEEDPTAFRFDANALLWRDERIDALELAVCRRERFVAYGSCSFTEPVDDLVALRMLPAQ